MNVKSEKGYTGVDIAISIVVLFIFVSLIAMLSYHLNSSAKEIELKAQATEIAVEEIEKLKNVSFDRIDDSNTPEISEIPEQRGFYKNVQVEDYADIESNKDSEIVKRVIVTIQYNYKNVPQKIELSTIRSKEN